MERDGSGIPAKTPFFFAHVQTVQECESPISLGWQEPVCSFLGGGAGGGELANCRACSGWVSPTSGKERIRLRERQQQFKCRLLQAFSSFQNFWFLMGEHWSCLTGSCGSLEPGGMKVVGGKVGLTCWAVSWGCCSLAGLSLEGSAEPLPSARVRDTHQAHHAPALQPLALSARHTCSRRESCPLSRGTVSGATAGSSKEEWCNLPFRSDLVLIWRPQELENHCCPQ